MALRWKSALVAISAALSVLIPSAVANAGEVAVPDPVNHGCYYVVGWYVNVRDVKNTNVYSYGYCTG